MWNPPSPSNHIVKSEVFSEICAYSKGMRNGGNKVFCYKKTTCQMYLITKLARSARAVIQGGGLAMTYMKEPLHTRRC
jgi:hypothetical protein